MPKSRSIELTEIVAHFQSLEDPRSSINRRHPLVSVLVIALMAVLSGADGPTAIYRWAQSKREQLLSVLDLPFGLPSKDVFRRVLMALDPQAFQECFMSWLNSMRTANCRQEPKHMCQRRLRRASRLVPSDEKGTLTEAQSHGGPASDTPDQMARTAYGRGMARAVRLVRG